MASVTTFVAIEWYRYPCYNGFFWSVENKCTSTYYHITFHDFHGYCLSRFPLYPSVMLGLFLYTDDSFVEVAINWFFRWKGPFKLMTRSSVMLSGVVLSYCLWWSTALLFVQTVYLHWCIFFVWSSLLFFFSYKPDTCVLVTLYTACSGLLRS